MTPEPLSPELAQQLWKEELAASQSAYAPYSNFHVGAALLTTGGEIVTGCNVENASYGLTTCAERTAIARAVAEQKLGDDDMRIRAIAVTNHEDQPCTPCGACRQIIMEFGREAMVLYGNSGQRRQSPITELLPESFQL